MPARTEPGIDVSTPRPLPSVILETTVSANYSATYRDDAAPLTVHRLVDSFNSCFLTSHNRVIPVRIVAEMSSTISSRGQSPSSSLHNDQQHNNMRNNRNASIVETPPPSPGSSRGSKHCCFCWCCCCSCSCLTVKSGKNNVAQDSRLDNMSEKEEAPTIDEVKSWSESFDKLMRSPSGRKIFREFLRGEYSEENMLFWLACEDLKKTENSDSVEEKARLIYEDYISILSPKEVSLDSRVRELINRNMVEPSQSTFDEAQMQIYTLMHRDSYPRFLNSQIYKRMQQNICA